MKRIHSGKNRLTAAILAALLLLSVATPALAETFSAIVTSSAMTVYKDARLSSAIGGLPRGTVVRVTAYSGKAARISYSGRTGYAKVSDMKSVDSVAAKAVVNASTKVYIEPDASSKSASVKKGAQVYVLEYDGDWATVEKDGAVGYMKLDALTKANDDWSTGEITPAPTATPAPAQKGTVTAESLPVYKKASTGSAKLGTLKKGQVVDVVSYNSKWAYIAYNGKNGYCAVKGLTKGEVDLTPAATASPFAYVSADKLPVYQSASAKSAKLGTIKKGQTVALLSESDGWAYIELNGNRGYCEASGLSDRAVAADPTVAPTPTPSVENAARGTVTASSLAVYKTASTGSEKVATLKKGDAVNVIQYNDRWAFIEHGGVYGFCAVSSLTRADADASPTNQPSLDTAVQATVSAESVAVYRLASTSSVRLGELMWGEQVNVLSVADGWAYIEKDGSYGFCDASALTKVKAAPDEAPAGYKKASFTATVVYPGAKAYESASTGAESVDVPLGARLEVIAYSTDLTWACVSNGSARAFMPVKHLSKTAYDTVDADGSAAQTLLKALLSYGYYDGVPSTSYNSAAVSAVKRFQAACGLSETGVADETVQRILYAGFAPASPLLSASMSTGDSGANVGRVQLRLYALGYLGKSESIDNSYGGTTAAAVALFQQANGISATGTADTATLKALYSTGAVSRPSSVKAADEAGASGGSVVTPSGTVKLSSTYVTTMPSELKSNTASFSSSMTNAQKLEHAIYSAQEKLGKPYVYGATGPNSFDCSGLTTYAFKQIGVSLKRSAYSQGYDTSYEKIESVSALKRGDLVFFNTISDSDLSDHVGIYLGGGCFIHASSGGHKVVVSNLTSGYYNRVLSWGRRILG